MYETINEFVLSNSEAVGSVAIIVTFLSVVFVGISPLIENVINRLMGG